MEVLIFGTGSFRRKVKSILNNNIKITAFIDNNKKDQYIENIPVIMPNEICNYKYDFIIIASMHESEIYQQLLKLNICSKKIISFYSFYQENLFFILKFKKFLSLKRADGIITGLSYYEYGINTDYLKKEIYNFACSSQDLFYDYMIAKYVLNHYRPSIKYSLIGLGIYSFEYDLSKSKRAYDHIGFRYMYNYYKILGSLHNMQLNNVFQRELTKYDFIFSLIDSRKINTLVTEENLWNNNSRNENILVEDNIYLNNYAKKLNAKNFEETRNENKKILENYIEMLLENNIKPIVLLLPLSLSLNMLISNELRNNFDEIICELKEKLDFTFLDYSKLSLDNSYFYDYEHLNSKGALYITDLINKEAF